MEKSTNIYRNVNKFVDSAIMNPLYGVDKAKLQIIRTQVEKIKTSPPEAVARFLLVVMKVSEEDDYIYITEILAALESDHEVRWVIRFVGLLTILYEERKKKPGATTIDFGGQSFAVNGESLVASNVQLRKVMERQAGSGKGKEKDVMLEKGVEVLLEFGKENDLYAISIKKIFSKNGVFYGS